MPSRTAVHWVRLKEQQAHGAGHQALHQLAMYLRGRGRAGRRSRSAAAWSCASATRSSSSLRARLQHERGRARRWGMGAARRQRAAHQQRRGAGSGRGVDLDAVDRRVIHREHPLARRVGGAAQIQQDPDRLGARAEAGIGPAGGRKSARRASASRALITPDGSPGTARGPGLDAARAGVERDRAGQRRQRRTATAPARHRREKKTR